jgi:predicted nucleic acid-binding protein
MIILDTNVLSELMRPKPSPRVVAWVAKQPATELFTTSITGQLRRLCLPRIWQAASSGSKARQREFFLEAEIFYGIELLTKGKRRDRSAQRTAVSGNLISHADAQIAAIAQVRGAKLATRNVADFQDCGLDRIDPWNGL